MSSVIPALLATPAENNGSFQFFRWSITKGGALTQFTEVYLYNGNVRISMVGAIASSTGLFSHHPPQDGIDGSFQTKAVSSYTVNANNPLQFTIRMPQPVSATSFSYVTGGDIADRDPTRWTMLGSADNITYILLQNQILEFVPPDNRLAETRRFTLSTVAPSVVFYRWRITATRQSNNLVQFQEVYLYNGGNRVSMIGAEAGSDGQGIRSTNNAIDGSLSTKLVSSANTVFTLTLQMPATTVVTGFSYVTGDDAPGRDPSLWTMSFSTDNITYSTVLHSRLTTFVAPVGRVTETARFDFT